MQGTSAFDASGGWCSNNAAGAEPGGVKGVICDVIPQGDDITLRRDDQWVWYLNGRRIFARGSNYISTQWLSQADRAFYEAEFSEYFPTWSQ